ncbi:hypothetical protein BAUCODRAFT_423226 [Baudoinia panamericana UAMH 10762]|uniref:F-box domain-containing protein n=1 Tax=Baudoinia panamericana (strain UAMH 10762) TaxID=717646 RepID=M2NH92_BAUPA|nr:uncharacterized protein BAUCODRAFT_423226 [Baudoinia panamericana UAMH 10762]EMC98395.1 hypothetical protein BAUCODRAFT_423226 [Baudoinia panamericana UAMH 10762]
MASIQLLSQLPEELLQDILERLDTSSLGPLSLVSRWCYGKGSALLWRDVLLEDRRTKHGDEIDDHDDTPTIMKLAILLRKPQLAACVHTLTYRCHLPPPAIFHELPRAPFSSQTLSTDQRLLRLTRLAVQAMTNVSTLRIIMGHPNMNDVLLRSFFDKHRRKSTPVRRLWLENCRISMGCNPTVTKAPYDLPLELDFNGLESIRFRRLPLKPGELQSKIWPTGHFVHARGCVVQDLLNGQGSLYWTSTATLESEQSAGSAHQLWLRDWDDGNRTVAEADKTIDHQTSPLERLFQRPHKFDELTWSSALANPDFSETLSSCGGRELDDRVRAETSYRGGVLDPLPSYLQAPPPPSRWREREELPASLVAIALLQSANRTLTSLTLDWVLTIPATLGYARSAQAQRLWIDTFLGLFTLRFPHLRAFQFRNAVMPETVLPQGLYLLDHARIQTRNARYMEEDDPFQLHDQQKQRLDLACLTFMEAHPNLQALAWPMEAFVSERPLAQDIASRVDAVIETLGRTLIDLRVDTLYAENGELQSESLNCHNPNVRDRRRRFVECFAARMRKVESIKIEGGVPRDERRETIRALHACPLKNIVMIGVSNPLGNTWGAEGRDLADSLNPLELDRLEPEDKEAVWQYGQLKPEPPTADFRFEANYGWAAGPPMLNIIATHFADTITELKFCGYKGCPALLSPTPITAPLLGALKHFHNLHSLVTSLWLSTFFDGSDRDAEIIAYWLDARSPASTALVHMSDDELEGWEKELRTKFAPDALAWRITNFIGPYLSETAKARKGGVQVRASFCIGDWGGIFDVDLHVGKGAMGSDVCLGFKGPMEELESERRRSKLENRRWF